jgi:hypothetical protein
MKKRLPSVWADRDAGAACSREPPVLAFGPTWVPDHWHSGRPGGGRWRRMPVRRRDEQDALDRTAGEAAVRRLEPGVLALVDPWPGQLEVNASGRRPRPLRTPATLRLGVRVCTRDVVRSMKNRLPSMWADRGCGCRVFHGAPGTGIRTDLGPDRWHSGRPGGGRWRRMPVRRRDERDVRDRAAVRRRRRLGRVPGRGGRRRGQPIAQRERMEGFRATGPEGAVRRLRRRHRAAPAASRGASAPSPEAPGPARGGMRSRAGRTARGMRPSNATKRGGSRSAGSRGRAGPGRC